MIELQDPANKYGVPLKTWRRWVVAGRHVFNNTHEEIESMGRVFYPVTMMPAFTPESHKIIAWNAAWSAAEAVTRLAREH